jgi:hypothetical protein
VFQFSSRSMWRKFLEVICAHSLDREGTCMSGISLVDIEADEVVSRRRVGSSSSLAAPIPSMVSFLTVLLERRVELMIRSRYVRDDITDRMIAEGQHNLRATSKAVKYTVVLRSL